MPNCIPLPIGKPQFFDKNGTPLAYGKVYSYISGTSTPFSTYIDNTGTNVNTNPTILDASGRASIWIGDTDSYTIVVKDADDVTQWQADGIRNAGDVLKVDLADTTSGMGDELIGYKASGSGSVDRTVHDVLGDLAVNVNDYGATGDGATDDTEAIQSAIDAATTISGAVYFQPSANYLVTSDIYVTCNVIAGSSVTITASGTSFTDGVLVIQANKTAGTTALLSYKQLDLPKVTNGAYSGGAWTTYKNGIVCNNLHACKVTVPYSYGFSVGLDVTSYGGVAGGAYSQYTLGYLMDCDYCVRLQPRNATGYVNENTFFGGKMGYNSGSSTGSAMLALLPYSGASNGPNSNKFYSPCVEGETSGLYAPAYHLIVGGQYNEFYGVRWEMIGGAGRLRFSAVDPNWALWNLFIGAYRSGGLEVSYDGGWARAYGNKMIGWGSDFDRYSTGGFFIQNPNGGTYPLMRFYGPTKDIFDAALGDTDWTTEFDANGLITTKGILTSHDVYPRVDDTYYLGKNSDASPLSWKGVILTDQDSGELYRLEIKSGVVTATLAWGSPSNSPSPSPSPSPSGSPSASPSASPSPSPSASPSTP